MGLVIGVFLRFRLAFTTRPYRKFTDDHRALDAVLRRLVMGADAIKGATRSYTSPWDMTSSTDKTNKKLRFGGLTRLPKSLDSDGPVTEVQTLMTKVHRTAILVVPDSWGASTDELSHLSKELRLSNVSIAVFGQDGAPPERFRFLVTS